MPIKHKASQKHDLCSQAPYSQLRQGLDTCYLTIVMIKATKKDSMW